MKARVIKEWEMYGITHKVGEIMTIPLHSPGGLPMISDRDAFLFDNGFIEEMKEPLIKQEKIRKAVRAWAEANEISQAKFDRNTSGFSASDAGNNFLSMISFDGFVFNCEDGRYYTIDELCGEEEE